MSPNSPKRYHLALVLLHWLLAFMLLTALYMGSVHLQHLDNATPEKLEALKMHMSFGGIILVLTLIRLVVRLKTQHPAPATTGNALLDKLAGLTHVALYVLVLMMAGSGIALSVQANLPAIVFNGLGTLPANFDAFVPRAVHGIVAKLLMLLIAGHFVAALYHQFVKRDGLLTRMGFGSR